MRESLLIIAAIFNLIAFFVATYRIKNRLTLSFAGITFFIAMWSLGLAGFIGGDLESAYFWVRVYYFAPLMIAASLVSLGSFLQAKRLKDFPVFSKLSLALLAAQGILVLAEPTLIVSDVVSVRYLDVTINTAGYVLYSAILLSAFGYGTYNLYKNEDATGTASSAMRKMLAGGFVVAAIFGVIFNLYLPYVGNYDLIWVGPLFSVILSIIFNYGVYRYRAFAISPLIFRSIIYSALLVLVSIAASLFAQHITGNLTSGFDNLFYGGTGENADFVAGSALVGAAGALSFFLIGALSHFITRSHSSLYFMLFSFNVGTFTFLASLRMQADSGESILLLSRAATAVAAWLPLSFTAFMQSLVSDKRLGIILKVALLLSALFSVVNLFGLSFEDVSKGRAGIVSFEPNFLFGLYLTYIATGIFFVSAYSLRIAYKQNNGLYNRVKLIVVAMLYGLVINYIFEVSNGYLFLLDSESFVSMRLLFSLPSYLIASITMAFAISRYRIFEFKTYLIRSLAYLLSIAIVFAMAISLVVGISSLIGRGVGGSAEGALLYGLIVLASGLTLPWLKDKIIHVYRKTFSANYYVTREALMDLSDALLSAETVKGVTHEAATVLEKYVKSARPEIVIGKKKNTSKEVAAGYELTDGDEVLGRIELRSLDGKQPSGQDDEFMKIAASMISLAVSHARNYEELLHYNENLDREVELATRSLTVSNQALIELNNAKDEFISLASHQLRTPLTAVKNYLSILDKSAEGNDRKGHSLNLMKVSAESMSHKVTELLLLSRIEAGKLESQPKVFDLWELVAQRVEYFKHHDKRWSNVFVERRSGETLVNADPLHVEFAVDELIRNATQYSEPGEAVEVSVAVEGEDARLVVVNVGSAISKNESRQLKNKLFRTKEARAKKPDGAGIGLYVVSELLEQSKGTLSYKNTKGRHFFTVGLKAAT